MKQVLKITACVLVIVVIIFISCKKELSCEGCKEINESPRAYAGVDQTNHFTKR